MIDAKSVAGYSDLAEASYVDFGVISSGGLSGSALVAKLADERYAAAWPAARRDDFATHWKIAAHEPNTSSGFSATLFERLNPLPDEQRYVVAMRGTEGNVLTQIFPDLLNTDAADIVANGLAWKQIIDMHNWWQRMTTPFGQQLDQISFVPISPLSATDRLQLGSTDIVIEVGQACQLKEGLNNEPLVGPVSSC